MASDKYKEPEPPWLFGDEDFTILYKEKINMYVEYRVRGFHSQIALGRAFGSENAASGDSSTNERVFHLESNPYYMDRFERRLKEIHMDELWSAKTSVHEMLSILRSPYTKDSTQLAAAKELNVVFGITIVDENGKTRAGRSLADFYKNVGMPSADDPMPGEGEPNSR
jgi:hypothetical protein